MLAEFGDRGLRGVGGAGGGFLVSRAAATSWSTGPPWSRVMVRSSVMLTSAPRGRSIAAAMASLALRSISARLSPAVERTVDLVAVADQPLLSSRHTLTL